MWRPLNGSVGGSISNQWSDFYVEIDTKQIDGPVNTGYGLIFRYVNDKNFYFYSVDANGYYSLWKLVDDQWQSIVDWTATDILATGAGAGNRIGVLAEGKHLVLVANDKIVTEVDDDSFTSGSMAVAVNTVDPGNAEIGFDNMDVWDLKPSTKPESPSVRPPADQTPTSQSSGDAVARLKEIEATSPTFSDGFSRDNGAWQMTSDKDVTFSYTRGALDVKVVKQNWMGWSLYSDKLTDFLLEADTAVVDGPKDAGYGLLFHFVDASNFYAFRINGQGMYSLWTLAGGEWKALAKWTDSAAIDTTDGAVNRLGVLVEGSQITLFVNGQVVDQVQDGTFPSGQIALVSGVYDTTGLDVEFDNVQLWNLKP